MAIEFFDGFDSSISKPEWLVPQGGTATLACGQSPRTGAGMGSIANTIVLPPSAYKTCGFAYYSNTGYSSDSTVVCVVGTGNVSHLTVQINASNQLSLLRGPDFNAGGVVIATSAVVWPPAQWRYLEIQATIADSGGTCIIRQDGVVVINYVGDTRNGGADTNITGFRFHHASSTCRAWDDMWVTNPVDDTANTGRPDNSFLGDLRCRTVVPSGNGASSQWVGSDGNSVDNYLNVDENPMSVSTADYNGSNVDGDRDLYAMADLAVSDLTVFAVRGGVYAAKSDGGTANVKVAFRDSGGTVSVGPDLILSTSFAAYYDIVRPANPATSAAWTVAEVNAIQVGVEASQ